VACMGVKRNTDSRGRLTSSDRRPRLPSVAPWLASLAGITPEELRPAFVFAHTDDAVFASFFAMFELGPQALDLVVCAGLPKSKEAGPWDRECGFSSCADARQGRLAEHKSACRLVGIRSITLDELDSQYSGSVPRGTRTKRLMLNAMRSARSNIVLTHGCASDHPDHRRVGALAQGAAEQLALPVVFTCDRPYFCCSAGNCASLGEQPRGCRMSVGLPDNIWKLKMLAVGLYASQHPALLAAFGPSWRARRRLGRECYLSTGK
jgi:LmbE family N-acetylglucosaminyl deacetylase